VSRLNEGEAWKGNQSKILLLGNMSTLTVNLTPYLYNRLCNIDKVLLSKDLRKAEEKAKAIIIENAEWTGKMKKQGQALRYWYDYEAVVANGYVYFYGIDDGKQKESFYFKSSQIEADSESLTLTLRSKIGDVCSMSFY